MFPAAIITVTNISIIIALKKRKQRRSNTMGVSTPANNIKTKSERSLTIMLITVSVLFLVTSLPVNVYYLLGEILHSDHLLTYAQNYMAYVTLNIIPDANNAFNFVLYFVSGAKFRRAFKSTFSRCVRGCPSFRSRLNGNPTVSTIGHGMTVSSHQGGATVLSNDGISVITNNSSLAPKYHS